MVAYCKKPLFWLMQNVNLPPGSRLLSGKCLVLVAVKKDGISAGTLLLKVLVAKCADQPHMITMLYAGTEFPEIRDSSKADQWGQSKNQLRAQQTYQSSTHPRHP